LVTAVEDYAARFAEASKIAVAVEASAAARRLDLAPDVEAQVFRIIQEALTNVRKHSGAGRATVTFSIVDSRLEVAIADDGHGLASPTLAADRPRYGLRAMRERADSIGATVDWSSPPGAGCRVQLTVATRTPIPAAAGSA